MNKRCACSLGFLYPTLVKHVLTSSVPMEWERILRVHLVNVLTLFALEVQLSWLLNEEILHLSSHRKLLLFKRSLTRKRFGSLFGILTQEVCFGRLQDGCIILELASILSRMPQFVLDKFAWNTVNVIPWVAVATWIILFAHILSWSTA